MKVRSSIFLMLVVMVVPASGFIEMLQDFFAALNPMADADTPDPTTPSPTAMSSYYNKPRNPTYPSPAPTSPYTRTNYKFPTPITYGTQPQSPYYPVPTAGYPSYYQNTLQNPASGQQSSGKAPFIYSPALPQPGSSTYQNTADASKNSFLTNPGSQAAQAYPQSAAQNAYSPNNYFSQSGYLQNYPQYDPNYSQSGSSYPMSGQYSQPYPQSGGSSQQTGQSPGSSAGIGGASQQDMNNYLTGLYFGLQNPGLMSLMDYFYGLPTMGSGMGSGMSSGLGGGLLNPGFGGGMGWPMGGMSGPLSGPMSLTLGPLSAPLARSKANSEMSPMDMAMTMHIMEAQDLI